MQPAQEKLKKALDDVAPRMRPPSCAVYMNDAAEPVQAGSDPKVITDLLKRQLVSPVLWPASVARMVEDKVIEFFDCGPKGQMKAIMKQIDNKVWQNTTCVDV